jgi:dihydrofolate synthase/folylpolyglutamate synthase
VRAPSYQADNIATAIAAASAALGHALDPRTARAALAALTFPGRFELVRADPPVVLDGAHNPEAASVLATAIAEAWPDPQVRPLALIGVLADKDAEGIVRELAPFVSGFACTAPVLDRALPAEELAATVEHVTGRPCATVPIGAVDVAWAKSVAPEGLLVTGSLYTVGRVRPALREAMPR